MSASYKKLLYTQIVFWVLAVLLVVAGLVRTSSYIELDRLLQLIAVLYSFAAVMVGLLLFRRRVEAIRASARGPREKLQSYNNAAMLQWILLVSANFFCGASYLLVGNWAFIALGMVLLVIYGGLNPFRQKVLLQLRLSEAEVAGL